MIENMTNNIIPKPTYTKLGILNKTFPSNQSYIFKAFSLPIMQKSCTE